MVWVLVAVETTYNFELSNFLWITSLLCWVSAGLVSVLSGRGQWLGDGKNWGALPQAKVHRRALGFSFQVQTGLVSRRGSWGTSYPVPWSASREARKKPTAVLNRAPPVPGWSVSWFLLISVAWHLKKRSQQLYFAFWVNDKDGDTTESQGHS